MVRSATWDSAWDVWPATLNDARQLLVDAEGTAETVMAALNLNAALATDNPQYSVTRLDPDRLAQHVAARWALPDDASTPARNAAARDRGFRDFTGAVNAVRSYYLFERDRQH